MHHFALASEQFKVPAAADSGRAGTAIERWVAAAEDAGDAALADFARAAAADPGSRRLLDAIFGNSPFLAQCAVSDPHFARRLFEDGPDPALGHAMAALAAARRDRPDEPVLARLLRRARRQVALAVAVADIAAAWPLERVTAALSDFADSAIGLVARQALARAAADGALALRHADDPERESGLVILGMGKLGARELNYSSDIDLIVLYDAEVIETAAPDALQRNMVRLTRAMLRLLDERTADGYVFRTDLRLRPDPGATPLALSVEAAETYYESLGQNWERAAMIKARPVAGDVAAGAAFLDRLRPYVWRKNLDFAAIRDIHSIKRQINAHRGGMAIAGAGHNIKLGRGGIREIEFFAQTQQLIWGGREPSLRVSDTVGALEALARLGKTEAATAGELVQAYRFLRRVEHRLQMTDDEQTHTLPSGPAALAGLAVFLGYPDAGAFEAELLATLGCVSGHYAELFDDAPALSADGAAGGNLVFTGGDSDPDTLKTLAEMGFRQPETVDAAVRGWHHGRYRAMRSTRAREILTELMPALLGAFGATADPDAAFVRFDAFLKALPAGVQLFSMFHTNPQLLDLLAEIMGGAPRLAEHLGRHPSLLESVLVTDFFAPPPPAAELAAEIARRLADTRHYEEVLDAVRRWVHDRAFQIGVLALRGLIGPDRVAAHVTALAEVALDTLFPRVEAELAQRHGRVPGGGMAVLAMGKLGGAELLPESDLDLVFVYDSDAAAEASDGARPLPPSQYFARLGQRFINALTALTAEGRLYEIDMRLRPSGNAGPIASHIDGFVRYQRESAWTWEHMALTRARAVAGDPALGRRAEAAIRDVLTRGRDADRLLADVADMRRRIEAEHRATTRWDIKHRRGGLVDVEFIAQYLQLRHAHDHPDLLAPNTRAALGALAASGLLGPQAAGELVAALDLWQALQGMLRLTLAGALPGEAAALPAALKAALARVGGAVDFAALEAKIDATAGAAHARFVELIEAPAEALPRGSDKETP